LIIAGWYRPTTRRSELRFRVGSGLAVARSIYDEQRAGDEVLSRPKKGKGASLTMRYRLPRNELSDGDAFRMET
jgi:hypothetical protein